MGIVYFMGLSQGLESWSGHGLSYWSGFLKWNPGEKVWSGTGNAGKYFFRIQRNFQIWVLISYHNHPMIS